MPKQGNMKQKAYKNPTEVTLCWSFCAEHMFYLYAQLICPVRFHWGKLIFFWKWILIWDSFLLKDESSCPLPPLSTETLSGLNLSYAHCPNLFEFIYVSVPLCLKTVFPWCHPYLLTLTIFLLLLPSISWIYSYSIIQNNV